MVSVVLCAHWRGLLEPAPSGMSQGALDIATHRARRLRAMFRLSLCWSIPMSAVPSSNFKPIWDQFAVLLPVHEAVHPLGCHRAHPRSHNLRRPRAGAGLWLCLLTHRRRLMSDRHPPPSPARGNRRWVDGLAAWSHAPHSARASGVHASTGDTLSTSTPWWPRNRATEEPAMIVCIWP